MKYPLKLPSNTSLERAIEAYADVAENLADSLELMNDLTDELDKLLAMAVVASPSQELRLKYLIERATAHHASLTGGRRHEP